MTEPTSDAPVSRARYERERLARIEAEALLEAKSRELFEANQRLILETETVRTALSETEALRRREATVLRERTILSEALTALSGKSSADEAMQALLGVLQSGFGISDAFFAQAHGSEVRIAAAGRPDSAGLVLPVSASSLARPRRLASLAAISQGRYLPDRLDDIAAVLIAPLALPGEQAGALMLGCKTAGRFSANDLKTLERVAQLAAQALRTLREARRNALLVSLIEGKPVSGAATVLDAPLEAIHKAFGRMTDMQGQVVGILDSLLDTPLNEADAGIDRALARLGEITGLDRVYVFRLRPDGAFIDNTHEWCAPQIVAMRDILQDVPAEMIEHWRATFDAGEDVSIPDVAALPDDAPEKEILSEQGIRSLLAVPLLHDGQFAGFVGYDAVEAKRSFLPGEIYLIRSVAKVIASVLARRDADARLRAAHAETTSQRMRLEAVLSAMPDLVVELDHAGRIVTWHSGVIVVPEAVARTVAGRSLEEALPATLAAGARGALAELDAGARTLNREFRHALIGEQERSWHLSASRVGDQGYLFVIRDVTERHEQAAALRHAADSAARARATLEAAVEALQDGFVLFDAQDQLVICNRKYREIYARSAAAIVPGASFESILRFGLEKGEYAEARGSEERWLSGRLTRDRAGNSEFEQQLADGRWLRIFERATPDGGRVGLLVDITALKLAEQRALADRSAAMEASQDGIAIADAEGRFLYMNKAHLGLFGYDDDSEVIGRPWTILYGPVEAAWMQANAMPELLRLGRWTGEVLGRSRNGAAVDQDVSLTLKKDGGILCIARNMLDRRIEAAERQRIREELHLAQRREIVGQMAAGLAHDFNNLLAAIAGSASLIAANAAPQSSAALGAQRIEFASGQAAELVKRLLTLGARQPERRNLDLRKPMTEAATSLRAIIKAPSQLILSLPDQPVEVTADPSDILQVVLNLCVNARDALDGGAGTITVALTLCDAVDTSGPFAVGTIDPACGYIALSIADTGPGMTPELIQRIFKPYVSTKGAKGTGLGLSIVGSVVKSNGGAVRLWSEPGQGTRVTILWPVRTAQARAPAVAAEALTGRLDGRRILVVDDKQEVLDVLTAFLEAAGAEVAPTTDPEDVLAALEADPGAWDLVVTDFDMPEMSGDALADEIARIAPDLPVILVTALAGIAGRTGARFAAVLGKPVDRNALVQSAESAILAAMSRDN